jgi:hypothetical protein
VTAPTRPRTVGDRLAEDLRATVAVLTEQGWSRDGLHHVDGSHDITGAVYVATGYHQQDAEGVWRAHPLERSAGRRATECIQWLVRTVPANTVWEWNDFHCPNRVAAVDMVVRAADNAERLLRHPRDVEQLLS